MWCEGYNGDMFRIYFQHDCCTFWNNFVKSVLCMLVIAKYYLCEATFSRLQYCNNVVSVLLQYIQCILAYLNPFGSLAQNFVQISEMLDK